MSEVFCEVIKPSSVGSHSLLLCVLRVPALNQIQWGLSDSWKYWLLPTKKTIAYPQPISKAKHPHNIEVHGKNGCIRVHEVVEYRCQPSNYIREHFSQQLLCSQAKVDRQDFAMHQCGDERTNREINSFVSWGELQIREACSADRNRNVASDEWG